MLTATRRWIDALALAALILVFGCQAALARSFVVANNTTPIAICTSQCTLTQVTVWSNSATIAYVKFYNTTLAQTTCGVGTPIERIMIPSGTGGAGAIAPIGITGSNYNALTACVTTGISDADATAPAAGSYLFSTYSK